jgi:predicted DNA-binding antitoxin AbrB/MazE fold protein
VVISYTKDSPKEAEMEEQQYEAVYEDDVFKPVEAVSLPKGTKVVVSVQAETGSEAEQESVDAEVLKILSRRRNSGQSDVAARHNEHQP